MLVVPGRRARPPSSTSLAIGLVSRSSLGPVAQSPTGPGRLVLADKSVGAQEIRRPFTFPKVRRDHYENPNLFHQIC